MRAGELGGWEPEHPVLKRYGGVRGWVGWGGVAREEQTAESGRVSPSVCSPCAVLHSLRCSMLPHGMEPSRTHRAQRNQPTCMHGAEPMAIEHLQQAGALPNLRPYTPWTAVLHTWTRRCAKDRGHAHTHTHTHTHTRTHTHTHTHTLHACSMAWPTATAHGGSKGLQVWLPMLLCLGGRARELVRKYSLGWLPAPGGRKEVVRAGGVRSLGSPCGLAGPAAAAAPAGSAAGATRMPAARALRVPHSARLATSATTTSPATATPAMTPGSTS
jgi:hypothetical protein